MQEFTVKHEVKTQYVSDGYGWLVPHNYDSYTLLTPQGKPMATGEGEEGKHSIQSAADSYNLVLYRETAKGLQIAIASALEALDPFLNANSPYTPPVLEAAAILFKALDQNPKPDKENVKEQILQCLKRWRKSSPNLALSASEIAEELEADYHSIAEALTELSNQRLVFTRSWSPADEKRYILAP